jgi:hypothetical protein
LVETGHTDVVIPMVCCVIFFICLALAPLPLFLMIHFLFLGGL